MSAALGLGTVLLGGILQVGTGTDCDVGWDRIGTATPTSC
jgi:hypothetical protein